MPGGDILVGNSSSDWANLPKGAANKVLVSDGTDVSWEYPSVSTNLTINNNLNTQPNTATISSGAIIYSGTNIIVDTESSASTDDLENVTGAIDGDILMISSQDTGRNVVLKHNGTFPGNLLLRDSEDLVLEKVTDTVLFRSRGGSWYEAARSIYTDFVNLKSTNGYTYLPNGLIFQWGYLTANGTITFPIAFPNAAINLTFGNFGGENGTPRGNTLTTTSFYYSSANFANTNSFWVAIGH